VPNSAESRGPEPQVRATCFRGLLTQDASPYPQHPAPSAVAQSCSQTLRLLDAISSTTAADFQNKLALQNSAAFTQYRDSSSRSYRDSE